MSHIKDEHLVTVKAVKSLRLVIILISLVVEYNYVYLFKCCTYIKLMTLLLHLPFKANILLFTPQHISHRELIKANALLVMKLPTGI